MAWPIGTRWTRTSSRSSGTATSRRSVSTRFSRRTRPVSSVRLPTLSRSSSTGTESGFSRWPEDAAATSAGERSRRASASPVGSAEEGVGGDAQALARVQPDHGVGGVGLDRLQHAPEAALAEDDAAGPQVDRVVSAGGRGGHSSVPAGVVVAGEPGVPAGAGVTGSTAAGRSSVGSLS